MSANRSNSRGGITTLGVQVAETTVPQAFLPDNEAPPAEMQETLIKQTTKKPVVSEKPTLNANEEAIVAGNETAVDETAVITSSNKKREKSKKMQFGEAIATPSASISVSKTKSEAAGINPALMSAYEATAQVMMQKRKSFTNKCCSAMCEMWMRYWV